MKINVEAIPEEGLNVAEQESTNILGVEKKDIKFDPYIDVAININIASNTLIVRGQIKTAVDLFCSRCLKLLKKELVNEDFNFVVDVTGLSEIDITENIRAAVLLLLPMKPLCKYICKGICPDCGQDLNEKSCSCKKKDENIRWNELDKLKIDNKSR